MKAVVIDEPRSVRLADLPMPHAGADEVVIRVRACGVCGTDLKIFHGGFLADYPVIPGHGFSGEIVEAGAAVEHVRVGDHVTIDPNISCGVCPFCRRGEIHLCTHLTALGVNRPGGFQEFCLAPAKQVYQLPHDLPWEAGAFVEPLACCVHGIDRAQIRASDTVVILGAGSIGLLITQLVRLAGASRVIVSEPSEEKAELARALGADTVLNPRSTDLTQAVRDLTGIGADLVIECVGHPGTVAQALTLPRRGGRVLLFGVNPKEAEVPIRPYEVFLNELTIIGSYINPCTHARAIDLVASGRVKVDPLVSHRLPLDDFPRAMEIAEAGGAVKIMVAGRS